MEPVVSIREAARMLGVGHEGLYPMVILLGLETRQHPSNPRAKGLTMRQVTAIRDVIETGRRALAQSA